MEKARAWLQDQKNMPIVLAGTVIIIALVVLMIMKTNGMLGGDSSTEDQFAPAPMSTGMSPSAPPSVAPSAPGATSTGTAPGTSAPAAPPPGVVSSTPAPTTVTASAGGAQTAGGMQPMLPYRKDPFSPLGGAPSVRNVLIQVLPSIRPPILPHSGNVKIIKREYADAIPAPEEPLPPQPLRRMAGVLMSGRLSAIMETNGESDIVKPGMTISKGGSTVLVESIEPSAIILKTLDTSTAHRIRVNLTGAIDAGPVAPNPGDNTSSSQFNPRRRSSGSTGPMNP